MLSAVNANPGDTLQAASPSEETKLPLSAACALLALMVQSQSNTQTGSKADAELDFKKMEELRKQLADAIQQAKDAANDSGFFGFLGDVFGSDVAQIAGAVAAVAAVVATGGAAGPLILIALAEGLQAAAKLGPELGIDPKICMALGLASAAVGICTGAGSAQAFGEVADVARGVELGAHVAQAGSTATGGAPNASSKALKPRARSESSSGNALRSPMRNVDVCESSARASTPRSMLAAIAGTPYTTACSPSRTTLPLARAMPPQLRRAVSASVAPLRSAAP